MEFLCLADIIINMQDIVIVSPRGESSRNIRDRQNKKASKGTSFYIRGKEAPMYSNVPFDKVLEQMKSVGVEKE